MNKAFYIVSIVCLLSYTSLAADYTCQKCGIGSYGSPLTGDCSRGGFHENISRSGDDSSTRYTCQKCGTGSYGTPLTGDCSRGGFHQNIKD